MAVKVGDRLIKVESRRGKDPRITGITVHKVGSAWAHYYDDRWPNNERMGGRFSLDNHRVYSGFSEAGSIYPDEHTYREAVRTHALWTELRRLIDRTYSIPPGVTQIGILKAADALGFRLESE